MARCDAALASIPAHLPQDMDVEPMVASINEAARQIRRLGIHNVPYPCGFAADGGWSVEQRRTALGVLDDEYTVLGDLADCFDKKLNVQTWEAVQGGAGWPMLWLSTYQPVGSENAWEVAQNFDLAASLIQGTEQVVAPQAELKPITAMNQMEVKMMLDTKEELSRLYQVTAGVSGYVRSQMAQ